MEPNEIDDAMAIQLTDRNTWCGRAPRTTLAHFGAIAAAVPDPAVANVAVTRALHLVDIENLVGACHLTIDVAAATAAQYLDVARHRPGDLCVVAASHHNGYAARTAFPGATVRWRSGRDGADLALLEALDEFDLDRFGRVVIGSGDGIFAETVGACRRRGLAVAVVGRPEAIASRLAAAAPGHARTAMAGTHRSVTAA